MYDRIKSHLGHRVEIASYANGENIAIECMECMEVIIDENNPESTENN